MQGDSEQWMLQKMKMNLIIKKEIYDEICKVMNKKKKKITNILKYSYKEKSSTSSKKKSKIKCTKKSKKIYHLTEEIFEEIKKS